MKYETELGLI